MSDFRVELLLRRFFAEKTTFSSSLHPLKCTAAQSTTHDWGPIGRVFFLLREFELFVPRGC